MKTMGQRAHHSGGSLAPALPNPLLGRGIGASSLPASPLVTTRAGADVLAQGAAPIAWTAGGYGTRSAVAGARHTGHGSARVDERHRQFPCRGWDTHGAMPGGLAPGGKAAAATHNLPQRTFRLNLRPRRARRLSKAGRHWAPITRQRATRKARHAGLAWPTYCNKPKGAPPVMDGMLRTVARGGRRCIAENRHLYLRVFQGPGHRRRGRPGLNCRRPTRAARRGPMLERQQQILRAAVRLARGNGGQFQSLSIGCQSSRKPSFAFDVFL